MIASCVPATPVDDNGFRLTAREMESYMGNRRVLGLGEVMDTQAVITGDPEMNAKIELFDGRIKDGHAPELSEEELAAYVLAGITTDHEGTSYEYIMRERSMGMFCLIREGSAARNLESIVKGIVENNTNTVGFGFCTDDRHIDHAGNSQQEEAQKGCQSSLHQHLLLVIMSRTISSVMHMASIILDPVGPDVNGFLY